MGKRWQQYHKEIQELYITKNWPLEKVRTEMKAKHGFEASVRAYRSRFEIWGLEKNYCKKRNQRKKDLQDKMSETSSIPPTPFASLGGGQVLMTQGGPQQCFEPARFNAPLPRLRDSMLQPSYRTYQPALGIWNRSEFALSESRPPPPSETYVGGVRQSASLGQWYNVAELPRS